MRETFNTLFSKPVAENGFIQPAEKLNTRYPTGKGDLAIGNGDVLIAAITSCTNTSNPGVLLAAGLLAKKAVEKGLTVSPHIKTTLAPGSRVVTGYLTDAGLLEPLAQLGFGVRGLWLHHLHRQLRPAGPADRRSHRQEQSDRNRRALRQPQFRSTHPRQHQGQFPGQPAAGGGLCHRRQDEYQSRHRSARYR